MIFEIAVVSALLIAGPEVTASSGEALDTVATEIDGKIIVYRLSRIVGMGVACPVRYKGKEIVELGRGKFTEWDVPAGRYILTNKTASVEVSVDPGETRYVRCHIKTGFLSGRSEFQIVDAESYLKNADNYERKDAAPFVGR